jgi:hypothetical protein
MSSSIPLLSAESRLQVRNAGTPCRVLECLAAAVTIRLGGATGEVAE